jgi:hypothetical protein
MAMPFGFGNRGQDNNGTGWAAANSVFWNCTAARIDCYKPPTAQNWAFGSWSQFAGDGYWNESNNSVNPRSLFYAQLSERVQKNVALRDADFQFSVFHKKLYFLVPCPELESRGNGDMY